MSAKRMSHAARLRAVRKEIDRLQRLAQEVLAADLAAHAEPGATKHEGVIIEGRIVKGRVVIDPPVGRRHRGGRTT